jgi:hypothetical protein
MRTVAVRLDLPTTAKDVRLIPPTANGKFNLNYFDR